ncbi:2'-5' RNA ligase family protein [Paenibacillus dakarensis]|uniref:2'-5' RNA ligase family protein n=1 Tax=Paenibacillus dakarensis TaxID=1527293 RepID=UPI0006D5A4A1|nr:2'-5' RNA ligase family protein [Paenibacillus dakarensis]
MEYYFGIVPSMDIYEPILSLREEYNYRGSSEPHITVKASCGLSEDMGWLPLCQKIISNFGKISISVGSPNYFGDKDILYLEAHSNELNELHRKLVHVFNPDEQQIKKCFELDLYKPHITIARKSNLGEEVIEEMKYKTGNYFETTKTFVAESVKLFYRESREDKYKEKIEINFN